jgi:lipoyl(octanoyl) transferase
MKKVNLLDLGVTDYMDALDIQKKIHQLRVDRRIEDTLILTQHKPVITLGKTADDSNILLGKEALEQKGVRVYSVNRGGDVTFHGPGQLVGYPILHLRESGLGVRDYLSMLLDVFVTLLRESYGLDAHKEFGAYTGVWIEKRKITAIGIQVLSQVTLHGFAYNVSTDLSYFSWIHPCGLMDRFATSLEKEMGEKISWEVSTQQVLDAFAYIFDWQWNWVELNTILSKE